MFCKKSKKITWWMYALSRASSIVYNGVSLSWLAFAFSHFFISMLFSSSFSYTSRAAVRQLTESVEKTTLRTSKAKNRLG